LTAAPFLSIVTPVNGASPEFLRGTVASVAALAEPQWELCLVDDCSADADLDAYLTDLVATDSRIRVHRRAERGGIVATTNDGLAQATGEFVALLDQGDLLQQDTIGHVRAWATSSADIDFLYTDEDEIDDSGHHFNAFLKPDWSPDRLRCHMYTGHLGVFRRRLVDDVGRMRAEFEGSHAYDLVLRVTERAGRVVHVPHVLYHRRAAEHAATPKEPIATHAITAARRALEEHFERTGFPAVAEPDPAAPETLWRPRPRLATTPLVSIVIPTGGQRRGVGQQSRIHVIECVRSILARTRYPAVEIVCVTSRGFDDHVRERLTVLAGDRVRCVDGREPFNFSFAVNRGVAESSGEHVILLNDDTEILDADWVERLLLFSLEPGVGAVGAKLLYGDGRLQHAGVVTIEPPTHAFHGWPGDTTGYFHNTVVAGNWAAVTAACLMTRRECFEEVGGFTGTLPLNYNDVDYCFKLRRAGYRIVCNPAARLVHYERSTRASGVTTEERSVLRGRWGSWLDNDPYYSSRFLDGADFAVSVPDRPRTG